MGLLQGATELFPVSSLGHSVIIPSLLHWQFKQSDPTFVPFLVLLHMGTAGALLVLYRVEWVAIIRGFFTAAVRGRITTEPERLAMLLLTGTIPAGILGVFFESRIKSLFANPNVAAGFLVVNGFLLLGFELLGRRAERRASLDSKSRAEQEEGFATAEHISFRAASWCRSPASNPPPMVTPDREMPGRNESAWHLSVGGDHRRGIAGRTATPGGGAI